MKKIIDELRTICDSEDELSIEFEGSPDEAVVIGTRQAYVNAAIKLLEIASLSTEAECEADHIQNKDALVSNHIKFAFNEFGATWPVAAYLEENCKEANELISSFKGSHE